MMARHRHGGFSLLELLVALFVIVIITSLVSLSVNSGGQEIELEARVKSLADISAYALDEAQMRGVDMGLLIQRIDDEAGDEVYRFGWRERMPEGWRAPLVDAEIFADQYFPPGIALDLELEDIVFENLSVDDEAVEEKEKASAPQVLFYSSGEVTSGSMIIREVETGDILWRIEWDLLGRFTLLRRGDIDIDDRPDESAS